VDPDDIMAELQARAFSVSEALSQGVSRGTLRGAVQRGELISLRKGLLVGTRTWQESSWDQRHELALRALIARHPGSFASHDSAAHLRGLPTEARNPEVDGIPVCHITRTGISRRDGWVMIHGSEVPPELVGVAKGIPASNIVRASIEQAASASIGRAAAHVDAAMRLMIQSQCGPRELREAVHDPKLRAQVRTTWHRGLDHFIGHRWVTRVRLAIKHSDPAAESYLESSSRVIIVLGDLPMPECGVPIRIGNKTYWADFCWKERGLIGEADGMGKYEIPGEREREALREQELRSAGWRIVRWGWEEAVTHPDRLLRLLSRELR
jgi:hypothetical protein